MDEERRVENNGIRQLCREKPYLIIAWCLLIAHLLLEILSVAFGIWPLSAMNGVSIFLYAFMVFFYHRLSRKAHIVIIYAEVLVFSLLAVVMYGDDSCYSVNIVPLLPILCYWDYESRYVYKDKKPDRRGFGATILVITLVYVIEQLIDGFNLYLGLPVLEEHAVIICFFNFVTLFVGVLVGTVMWWFLTDHTAGLLEISLKEADYFANHDILTGLKNRKSFDEYMTQLERTNQEYAFMIADVDDFKIFNDTNGHDCGDMVLQKLSALIHQYVRSEDQIFRWGGEEIVIIMTNIHRKRAEERAVEICRAIAAEESIYNGKKISITVTIGVTVSKGRVFNEVMREADQFLFTGKERGKNCACGADGIL